MTAPVASTRDVRTISEWSIDSVIDEGAIRSVFQPIVNLTDRTVVGFEALSRGPAGSAFESPLALIRAARESGRLGELDWLCRTQAMRAAVEAGLPDTLSWLINVEPAGLAMECPPCLLAEYERARSELRVILEIVERDVDGRVLDVIRATDEARLGFWGVALDDVGANDESLGLLTFVRPDVVKLDMSLIQGPLSKASASVTAAVRSYAESRGAVVIAEGIETHAHEQVAKAFGATYGQGYYYARPGALPTSVAAPVYPIPLRQYVEPLDGRTPFEVLSDTVAPQRCEKRYLAYISSHLEERCVDAPKAAVLLAGFQKGTFFSRNKQSLYRQLATSNALTVVLAEGLTCHDEPRYHIGPLRSGSRLGNEWIVMVMSPHCTAAIVARDCGEVGPDGQRQFDFIYSHDPDAVAKAARSFVQELGSASTRHGATSPSPRIHKQATERPHRLVEPVHSDTDDLGTGPLEAIRQSQAGALDLVESLVVAENQGFRATAQVVLDYLNKNMPMAFWSITRVENDRQTYLYLDDNDYGLAVGDSHPWQASYCVHMVAGTAPRLAPDAAAIPLYANAAVNQAVKIGAYAGAPIAEADGTLFGVICGLDRVPRYDVAQFGPILNLAAEVLTISLRTDRSLQAARAQLNTALTYATTDSLTGVLNRHAWDAAIAQLDLDYRTYADPTIIIIVDLDNLKRVNDGPGGHSAGDRLLRDAAHIMRRSIRTHDILARIGGDEFGIILTKASADPGPSVAARLIHALDRAGISASVGWSPLRPDSTVADAVSDADKAMYKAKRERKSALPPSDQ